MSFLDEPICDIHTHIIPGVDDGASSLDESLAILEEEMRQGVGFIVLTPHFRKRMFETPESEIYSHYKILLLEAAERFPELELQLGCEFHAIMDMEEELQERRFAAMSRTSSLLLEFSGRHAKSFIRERTMTALMLGYRPILAHIERYPALVDNPEVVGEIRDMGARIQINADSVLGLDGPVAKNFSRRLLKEGLVDFIGSDVHNTTWRTTHIGPCAEFVAEKYGEAYADQIFRQNPAEFFD